MRYRMTTPQDLRVARDFIPAGYRYSPEAIEALPSLWDGLLRSERLNTAVVDDPNRPEGERVLGIGLSVFVEDSFADEVLANPRPYLNARLHEMLLSGNAPILDKKAIARANSNGGLTLMPLHFATASFDTKDPEIMRTLLAAQDLFRLVHAGFRVKRMLKEVIGVDLCRYMLSSGMLLHSDHRFARADAAIDGLGDDERPFLLSVEHADLPLGSILSVMFAPPARRFKFSPAEQRLLRCALLYETDDDIGRELGLSRDTLRKQWRSIFERVLCVDPMFFPDDAHSLEDSMVRGRGKRRHLLQYLRMYLEEVRPYQKVADKPQRPRHQHADDAALARQPA